MQSLAGRGQRQGEVDSWVENSGQIVVDEPNLPPLVRIALVHGQFETIHPFLDGNGRVGRLLIAALLEQWGLLPEPLVYLSSYLKQNQAENYRRLSAVRTDGDWESWVGFFLDGVETAATDAERGIVAIASLVAADRRRLLAAPRVGAMGLRLFELLPLMPRLTIEQVRQKLTTTAPTATAAPEGRVKSPTADRGNPARNRRCASHCTCQRRPLLR